MTALFDAHCHIEPSAYRVLSQAPSEIVGGRLLCGVGESDWDEIAAVATHWRGTVPAYGIHPWHANEIRGGWPERLETFLAADPAAWLGEVGLDGIGADLADPETQERIFREQLRLAERLDRPVNLHCVKAWEALAAGLDAEYLARRGSRNFIIHSFAGPHQYVKALADRGAYFTIGPLSSRRDSPRQRQRVALLPEDRLLLESDAFLLPGSDDVRALESSLSWLADVRGMSLSAATELVAANFRRLFHQ